jgi:hypothetical protein
MFAILYFIVVVDIVVSAVVVGVGGGSGGRRLCLLACSRWNDDVKSIVDDGIHSIQISRGVAVEWSQVDDTSGTGSPAPSA